MQRFYIFSRGSIRAVKTTPEVEKLHRISSTQIKTRLWCSTLRKQVSVCFPSVCIKQLSSRLIPAALRQGQKSTARGADAEASAADGGYNWLSGRLTGRHVVRLQSQQEG